MTKYDDDFELVNAGGRVLKGDDDGWADRSTPADDLRFEVELLDTVRVGLEGEPPMIETNRFRMAMASEALGVRIGFPWWDNLSDIQPLIDWLRSAGDGERFSDCDQGWTFDAVRKGDRFHFLDGDLDTGERFANVSIDRARILGELPAAEKALREPGRTRPQEHR